MHAARDGTWKWWWLAAVGGLALIMMLGTLLAGCENGQGNGRNVTSRPQGSPSQQSSPGTAESQSSEANADEAAMTSGPAEPESFESPLPAATVTADEAVIDLGQIRPNTTHRMAFDIVNAGDAALAVEGIRRDCECISAVSPPQTLPAGKTTRVNVVYEAPDAAVPYKTRLTVVTDSPQRRFISLWVKSQSVRKE